MRTIYTNIILRNNYLTIGIITMRQLALSQRYVIAFGYMKKYLYYYVLK